MSKVAVVTDSTAYIPDDLLRRHNITVTPQVMIWGPDTYLDGVDILPDEFYKRLATAREMPTTSQVSIISMKTAFEELLGRGFDVLGMFISSGLSGTVDSAQQALAMLPAATSNIAIVDSRATSMALGYQVLAVARAAQQGATLEDCRKMAEAARAHTGVLFVVDTLEFLHRGGRIGGAQKFLGTALNLKPILELRDGRIESVDKVRTKSKAFERVLELLVEKIAGRAPVRLATLHANAEADARSLLADAVALVQPVETACVPVSPAVGTHVGPGTVGIAFMAGM